MDRTLNRIELGILLGGLVGSIFMVSSQWVRGICGAGKLDFGSGLWLHGGKKVGYH